MPDEPTTPDPGKPVICRIEPDDPGFAEVLNMERKIDDKTTPEAIRKRVAREIIGRGISQKEEFYILLLTGHPMCELCGKCGMGFDTDTITRTLGETAVSETMQLAHIIVFICEACGKYKIDIDELLRDL